MHIELIVDDLRAQRIGEAADRGLRAAVDRLQRNGAVGQCRADVDDGAAVAHAHPAQRRHRAVHLAEVGHRGATLELLGRELADRGEHRGHGDIHPDVDRAQLVLHSGGGGLDRLVIGDVGGDRQCAHAVGLAQFGRCPLQPLGVAR